ncbi:alpha/beta hydrolase [Amphritea sp. 1_MG-2023]|uniref:alpha/beta fold hydrolase n=1 Tax=Amphritea sp. 1_MG-2023 TaxID=3062670 RepID=UPI0026E3C518|nr:alpha/beta hydrolase [Amphritea sp. 1_MG-2023]MDO6564033.1 alpha/beta hydrolase [Amphritea sp. 1_MG-2023]
MTIYKSSDGEHAVKQCYNEVLTLWPVAVESLTLPTHHGDTHVLACGDATLPPLLLMHGAMSNATAWLHNIEEWSKHFRLYAIDMIGEPGLSAAVRLPMDSDAYALWLDEVMQGLSLSNVAIVGESLGGWLALDYANRRPENVNRLALLVPGGVGPQRKFLLKALPLMLLGKWGKRKVHEMIFGPEEKNPSAIDLKFQQFFTLISQHVIPRLDKLPIFSDQTLQTIKAPTLAIVAGKDVLLDAKATQARLEANLADIKVIYQANARHLIRDRSDILTFLMKHNHD